MTGFNHQRRFFRGEEVVFENTAAALLCIPAKRIRKIVSLERERFPKDFLFKLAPEEKRLFNTEERYAFTLIGLLMLATLSNPAMAVKIMRTHTILRKSLALTGEETDIFDLLLHSPLS